MIHQAIPTVVIAGTTAAASVIGQLGSNTTITIGEALTVFVFVATLVAWLSRKLQQMEDDQKQSAKNTEEIKIELSELKEHLASLPCNNGACLPPKK